ncbi:MAG: cytochrome P450, partial [Kangiellaceae bacterium]|nr:cytochrome P450 [Kangiellaceae bacterium]
QIPSIAPSDPVFGNQGDIVAAGGINQFLTNSHNELGPIFKMWWGQEEIVSLGTIEYWKDTASLFDRPIHLIGGYKQIFGEWGIFVRNGPDAAEHRKKVTNPPFTTEAIAKRHKKNFDITI